MNIPLAGQNPNNEKKKLWVDLVSQNNTQTKPGGTHNHRKTSPTPFIRGKGLRVGRILFGKKAGGGRDRKKKAKTDKDAPTIQDSSGGTRKGSQGAGSLFLKKNRFMVGPRVQLGVGA